jgi:hypothetical protein
LVLILLVFVAAVLAPFGFLDIEAKPESRVFIDGIDHGTTPLQLRVNAGEHQIRVMCEDGRTRTVSRNVEEGKKTVLRVYW